MERYNCLPRHLAKELGISHSTLSRWLSGKNIPSSKYCHKLSQYSGTSLDTILAMVGYIPKTTAIDNVAWPEFREYASKMYPQDLDEDTISFIEDIIEYRKQRRIKNKKQKNS